MERWYMLESTHQTALALEKSVHEVEYSDIFGHHDETSYAAIREKLIQEAGGFEKLTAAQFQLIEEQAREKAARCPTK